MLFGPWRRWRERREQEAADRVRQRWAIDRALALFAASRGIVPMAAHVLAEREHDTIVRVMFYAGHIPPDRAWYAVPVDGGAPRELSFEDVRSLETRPWR